MKFCSNCGSPVQQTVPEGDDRIRHVCNACDTIHYLNPKIVAGCIPVWDNKILLCKRGIKPRRGYWTLPAGYMELGETATQAAVRETFEEANSKVTIDALHTILSLPRISQVYMFFRATMSHDQYHAGLESLETKLFREQEIPWDDLSFPSVKRSLQLFVEDRKTGLFKIRVEDIYE